MTLPYKGMTKNYGRFRGPCRFSLQKKPGGQGKLCGQDGGDTQGEFQVAGLMADSVHSDQHSDASTHHSHCQKGGFRDPPEVFSGVLLVRKHNQESGGIDYKEVAKQILHKTFQGGSV